MSSRTSAEEDSFEGYQGDRYLFIDAQDVIQLKFLTQTDKEGRDHYKVGEDQFLHLGQYWRRLLKEMAKQKVKIVLLEEMKEVPSDKSRIQPSPLEKLFATWHNEGVCPEVAAKIIYTKSNPADFFEQDPEKNVFYYRCKGTKNGELSTFFEEQLGILEKHRKQHFILTSKNNYNFHKDYKQIKPEKWNEKKKRFDDRKTWDSSSFFMSIKHVYFQLTEAKVFERLLKYGPLFTGAEPKLELGKDGDQLNTLIDDLYSAFTSVDKPNPTLFAQLRKITKDINEGRFNRELLIDPDPGFQTRGKLAIKGDASVVKSINDFLEVYKKRFDEQILLLEKKSKNLQGRGFDESAATLKKYIKKLENRFDWFSTLYSYEKNAYIHLFGFLDCIEDCEAIIEEAKNTDLKEHRGWKNIFCNIGAFFAASIFLVPMIIYCCYYAIKRSQGVNLPFLIQLKTESIKLLENTQRVIRVPELCGG